MFRCTLHHVPCTLSTLPWPCHNANGRLHIAHCKQCPMQTQHTDPAQCIHCTLEKLQTAQIADWKHCTLQRLQIAPGRASASCQTYWRRERREEYSVAGGKSDFSNCCSSVLLVHLQKGFTWGLISKFNVIIFLSNYNFWEVNILKDFCSKIRQMILYIYLLNILWLSGLLFG